MKAWSLGGSRSGSRGRGLEEKDGSRQGPAFGCVMCSHGCVLQPRGQGLETSLCSAHKPGTLVQVTHCVWKGLPFLVHKMVPPGPVLDWQT